MTNCKNLNLSCVFLSEHDIMGGRWLNLRTFLLAQKATTYKKQKKREAFSFARSTFVC
jgi:hypothetical protein